MQKLLLTLLISLSVLCLRAQPNIDSLWGVWNNTANGDSVRLRAMDRMIDSKINLDQDSALILIGIQQELAERSQYPWFMCKGQLSIARVNAEKGNFLIGIEHAEKALEVAEKINDKTMISLSHNVLGIILGMISNHSLAIEHYLSSLKIAEEIGDSAKIAIGYRNVGIAFSNIKDDEQEEFYFLKSLEISELRNDKKMLPFIYFSLGDMYKDRNNSEKALEYYKMILNDTSLVVSTMIKGNVYGSLAQLYRKQLKKPLKAIEYYRKSLALKLKIGNKRSYSVPYTGLGRAMLDLNKTNQAILYCDTALIYARQTNLNSEKFACMCLYDAYKRIGNSDSSLFYLELVGSANDSLINIDREKEINRKELGYQFEKKAFADSLTFVSKQALAFEKIKKQRIGLFAVGGGLILLLALAFSIYSGKKKSDELLLNILPYETAQELKKKGYADAKLINEVTVLFTDFKGFTAMAEQMTASELVEDLNICFSEFDHIMGKYGIEKIKTIGDAYMAAGGLPSPNETHATDIVKAAFEMRDFIEVGKAKKMAAGLPYFEIRIGIHTGPVVAGIVGIKKFQYDIWGDTVNTASRMESNGEAGKVNISQSTYELLMNDPQFEFENRGKIEAKGKGEIEMFFISLI